MGVYAPSNGKGGAATKLAVGKHTHGPSPTLPPPLLKIVQNGDSGGSLIASGSPATVFSNNVALGDAVALGIYTNANFKNSIATVTSPMGTFSRVNSQPIVNFSSPPVGGLAGWFDASQITGAADGSTLTAWSDLSGNAHNLTGTGTYYSSTAAKLINNLPAVWFDGATNQFSSSSEFRITNQPITILAVAKSVALGGTQVIASSVGTGASSFILYRGGGVQIAITSDNTGSDYLSGGTQDVNTHVFGGIYNSTSSAAYLDNTLITNTGTSGTAGMAGTFTLGQIATGGDFWNGPICEVLVYPVSLTANQIAATMGYLATKWGILETTMGNNGDLEWWVCLNTTAVGKTATATCANGATSYTSVAYEISGGIGQALAASGSSQVGGLNPALTSTPHHGDDVILQMVGANSVITAGPSAPWTAFSGGTLWTPGTGMLNAASQVVPNTSPVTGTWTQTSSFFAGAIGMDLVQGTAPPITRWNFSVGQNANNQITFIGTSSWPAGFAFEQQCKMQVLRDYISIDSQFNETNGTVNGTTTVQLSTLTAGSWMVGVPISDGAVHIPNGSTIASVNTGLNQVTITPSAAIGSASGITFQIGYTGRASGRVIPFGGGTISDGPTTCIGTLYTWVQDCKAIGAQPLLTITFRAFYPSIPPTTSGISPATAIANICSAVKGLWIEWGNELPNEMGSAYSSVTYMAQFASVVSAVHAADPTARIAPAPFPQYTQFTTNNQWNALFTDATHPLTGVPYDFISNHAYAINNGPHSIYDQYLTLIDAAGIFVNTLQTTYSVTKPIYVTEIGWDTGASPSSIIQNSQSVFMIEYLDAINSLLTNSLSSVTAFDDVDNGGQHFGWLEAYYNTPKQIVADIESLQNNLLPAVSWAGQAPRYSARAATTSHTITMPVRAGSVLVVACAGSDMTVTDNASFHFTWTPKVTTSQFTGVPAGSSQSLAIGVPDTRFVGGSVTLTVATSNAFTSSVAVWEVPGCNLTTPVPATNGVSIASSNLGGAGTFASGTVTPSIARSLVLTTFFSPTGVIAVTTSWPVGSYGVWGLPTTPQYAPDNFVQTAIYDGDPQIGTAYGLTGQFSGAGWVTTTSICLQP